jgi:hypothetical protein
MSVIAFLRILKTYKNYLNLLHPNTFFNYHCQYTDRNRQKYSTVMTVYRFCRNGGIKRCLSLTFQTKDIFSIDTESELST